MGGWFGVWVWNTTGKTDARIVCFKINKVCLNTEHLRTFLFFSVSKKPCLKLDSKVKAEA